MRQLCWKVLVSLFRYGLLQMVWLQYRCLYIVTYTVTYISLIKVWICNVYVHGLISWTSDPDMKPSSQQEMLYFLCRFTRRGQNPQKSCCTPCIRGHWRIRIQKRICDCFQYADPVSDLLDKCGCFKARLFRESCVFHRGNYVKVSSIVLDHTIMSLNYWHPIITSLALVVVPQCCWKKGYWACLQCPKNLLVSAGI